MHSARVYSKRDAEITNAKSFLVTIEIVKIDKAIKKDNLLEVKL